MYLDLDDFKAVNDSLGHAEADRLLRFVAARLVSALRPGDTAARLGGDEFALLVPEVDQAQARALATRVLAEFSIAFDLADHSLHVGASVGIALSSPELSTAAALLSVADVALYRAKGAGKGDYALFEEIPPDAAREAAGESEAELPGPTGLVTLRLVTSYEGHELAPLDAVIRRFEATVPMLRVEVVGGVPPEQIVSSIHGADPPDVVISMGTNEFISHAGVDGLVDLRPYLARDVIDEATFSPLIGAVTVSRTKRWALPLRRRIRPVLQPVAFRRSRAVQPAEDNR